MPFKFNPFVGTLDAVNLSSGAPGPPGTNGKRGVNGIAGQDGADADDTTASVMGMLQRRPDFTVPYQPGTMTIAPGRFAIFARHLRLLGTERLSIQGNATLRLN